MFAAVIGEVDPDDGSAMIELVALDVTGTDRCGRRVGYEHPRTDHIADLREKVPFDP